MHTSIALNNNNLVVKFIKKLLSNFTCCAYTTKYNQNWLQVVLGGPKSEAIASDLLTF